MLTCLSTPFSFACWTSAKGKEFKEINYLKNRDLDECNDNEHCNDPV